MRILRSLSIDWQQFDKIISIVGGWAPFPCGKVLVRPSRTRQWAFRFALSGIVGVAVQDAKDVSPNPKTRMGHRPSPNLPPARATATCHPPSRRLCRRPARGGSNPRAFSLGRRPRAEFRSKEEVAAAEAELRGHHSVHAAGVVLRGLERPAACELAAPWIRAKRLAVIGMEADEIHPHLRHLVEEIAIVVALPGRRAVEEVVPGQAAAACRR